MINYLLNYERLCAQINKVKDFLLFKKIFENAWGSTQSKRFEDRIRKLSNLKGLVDHNNSNIEIIFNDVNYINIFKNIKEELAKADESKSNEFIKQMIALNNFLLDTF